MNNLFTVIQSITILHYNLQTTEQNLFRCVMRLAYFFYCKFKVHWNTLLEIASFKILFTDNEDDCLMRLYQPCGEDQQKYIFQIITNTNITIFSLIQETTLFAIFFSQLINLHNIQGEKASPSLFLITNEWTEGAVRADIEASQLFFSYSLDTTKPATLT